MAGFHLVLLSTILAFAVTITEQCISSASTPTTSDTTPNPCPHPGYTHYPGFNCYKAYPGGRKTWSEAREQCISDGGDLMVADSKREKEDVFFKLFKSVSWNRFYVLPWMGVYIPQGGNNWMTVKGEPALSDWFNYYARMQDDGKKCAAGCWMGVLDKHNCADIMPFICEIPL